MTPTPIPANATAWGYAMHPGAVSAPLPLGSVSKGTARPTTLPAPPPGTYDPSLDYEAGAANRGLQYQQDDAATQFETGTQQHNATLAQLLTSHTNNLADIARGYSNLGAQQRDAAAAHGITSAGLLGLSQAARDANQTRDTGREDASYTTAKNAEDFNYANVYGGYNGQTVLDPYTGQSVVGSLVTSLGRSGIENTAYQTGLGSQKVYQAQQGGYIAPSVTTNAMGWTPGQAATFAKQQRKVGR